jgi:hypothetical protein
VADEKFDRLDELKNEIKMADAINKEEVTPILVENIRRYTGEFVPQYGVNWDIALNEVFPIIQNSLPSIFFRNPRAFLKPRTKTYIAKRRDPVSGRMVEVQLDASKSARTQEHILNYYTGYKMKYKAESRRVLLDALLFPYAVMWHGYKGNFGYTEEASMFIKQEEVFVKRINPLRFVHDPFVNMAHLDEGKWVGRIIDVPLRDLLEDDELDVDKQSLKGFPGYGEKIGAASQKEYFDGGGKDFFQANKYIRSVIEYADKNYKDQKGARFVRLYEIYHRPSKKEAREGKKGKIILLTDEQKKPLRINEWTTKAEGFPCKILEFNSLNDSQFGIDDVKTYKSIADQKNVVVNQFIRNSQENSKVWVSIAKSGTSEEDIQRIKSGDQTIVLFEGDTVQGKMSVTSAAGMGSSELPTMYGMIDKNLQDKSGVSDLKKGFLQSGEESATSVKLRSAGGSARPAYRQDIMSDFLKESFTYTLQLLKQYVSFDEAVRVVGSLDLEWSEAPSEEDLQAEVDIELDVISMLPEDPDKELQELQMILNLMIQGLSDPNIKAKLEMEGKTINLSPIIEQMLLRLKIRNPDVFRAIKPEESQGFVSVQQLQEAKGNTIAALTGQGQIVPPQPTNDHRAQLELYTTIQQLLQLEGRNSQMLDQLVAIQSQLLQQQMDEAGGQVGQQIRPKSQKTVTT